MTERTRESLINTGQIKLRCTKIKIKAGNAGNSHSITKFSKAFSPAGDEDMGSFALQLIRPDVIRGFLVLGMGKRIV